TGVALAARGLLRAEEPSDDGVAVAAPDDLDVAPEVPRCHEIVVRLGGDLGELLPQEDDVRPAVGSAAFADVFVRCAGTVETVTRSGELLDAHVHGSVEILWRHALSRSRLPYIDRTAARDQTKAHIETARTKAVGSAVSLIFALERLDRGTTHVESSIDRIARSQIKLSLSRRRLAG